MEPARALLIARKELAPQITQLLRGQSLVTSLIPHSEVAHSKQRPQTWQAVFGLLIAILHPQPFHECFFKYLLVALRLFGDSYFSGLLIISLPPPESTAFFSRRRYLPEP